MLNHDKTEIHRTSLTLKKIKQECMSFSKEKIVIRPVTLLRTWAGLADAKQWLASLYSRVELRECGSDNSPLK